MCCAHTWAPTASPLPNRYLRDSEFRRRRNTDKPTKPAISLINKSLWPNWARNRSWSDKFLAAQPIEIRGFRLTLPFPLAYDGNRKNQQIGVFLPDYAIFDLASGTVLDRGDVATPCSLDAARLREDP